MRSLRITLEEVWIDSRDSTSFCCRSGRGFHVYRANAFDYGRNRPDRVHCGNRGARLRRGALFGGGPGRGPDRLSHRHLFAQRAGAHGDRATLRSVPSSSLISGSTFVQYFPPVSIAAEKRWCSLAEPRPGGPDSMPGEDHQRSGRAGSILFGRNLAVAEVVLVVVVVPDVAGVTFHRLHVGLVEHGTEQGVV